MSEARVSVVIPTLNSAETLERCLTSIKANNTKYEYEVIVVDAGSNDETIEIARKYAHKVLDGMPSRINRNIGVEAARGEIICFTDSDCFVPEDWIDRLVDGLLRLNVKDNKIVGVGGGNIPSLNNPSLEELAVSKADSALDAKLVEKGYKLYYVPNLLVYHRHASDIKRFSKQMYAYGWGRVKLGKRHRKYFQFHHYGPIFLCLMTFSPLFFIPLGMALANAIYVSLGERNRHLFPPLVRLTISFYVNYGRGEILALRGKQL